MHVIHATAVDDVLQRWADAWNAHDSDGIRALFAPDCVYEDVTYGVVCRGPGEVRAFAEGVFKRIPDFTIDVKHGFATARRGALEYVMSGTREPGEPGRSWSFSVRGVTVVELRDGLIVRNSDYWDAATVARQNTAVAAPLTPFMDT